jgi:hypothetical protein
LWLLQFKTESNFLFLLLKPIKKIIIKTDQNFDDFMFDQVGYASVSNNFLEALKNGCVKKFFF